MVLATLFRFVEVLCDAPAGGTLYFSTDLPNGMAVRATASIPLLAGRHPHRVSLPGYCKGKLYQVKISPPANGTMRIYEMRVYARVLGPQASLWAWYVVPVLETASGWEQIKLPIVPTSDVYEQMKLPIAPTSDEWQEAKLPIAPTSDDWQQAKLPIAPTSEEWQEAKLPIAPTSDLWEEAKLPVKETPVLPGWVDVPVDQ